MGWSGLDGWKVIRPSDGCHFRLKAFNLFFFLPFLLKGFLVMRGIFGFKFISFFIALQSGKQAKLVFD